MSVINRRFGLYLILPLAALLAVVLYRMEREFAAASPAKQVLLVVGGTDRYWQAIIRGAQVAAQECGVNLRVEGPRSPVTLPLAARAGEAARDVAYFGVIAAPGVGGEPIEAWEDLAAHTNLVTIGQDVLPEKRRCHVSVSDYSTGRLAAAVVRETLPQGGVVVVLAPKIAVAIGQMKGLQDSLANMNACNRRAGIPVEYAWHASVVLGDGPDGSAIAFQEATAVHPKVDMIIDFCGDPASSMLRRMRELPSTQNAKLVTLDFAEEALQAIETGDIAAVLAADPFSIGRQAVASLSLMLRDGELGAPAPGKGHLKVFPYVVRPGGVAQFRAHRDGKYPPPAA